ncbi:PIN domain-containing protein [Cupriavidus sp. 30B13]|uniref:PIN domain-containing protein n=1 Tax=Cupriavidus sp. 30B13 TaxID=3384241 RepID=UPI003B9010ED
MLFAPGALGKMGVETKNIIGSMSHGGLSGEDWQAHRLGRSDIDEIGWVAVGGSMMGASAVVLVDFENVQNIDFSQLEGSRLVVFAGEVQRKVPIEVAMGLQALGERARWVRSSGVGPNALDFHIALEIGRIVEKGERGPVFVLSRDRGFDPLLTWLGVEHRIPARHVTCLSEAFGTGPADADAERHASGPAHPSSTPVQTARATPAPAAAPVATSKPSANGKPTASTLPKAAKAAPAKMPAKKTTQPQPGNGKKGGGKPSADLTRQILARSQKATRPRRRATLAKHIHAMFKVHAIAEREVESIIAKLIANRSISDAEGEITYHF